MTMMVTAVLVTFNRSKILKRALDELLATNVTNVVVVNNASTDDTARVLASYSDLRLHVTHLETNLGGAGGFAYGINEAVSKYETDYVWLMDDDTIVNNDALTELEKIAYKLDNQFGFLASLVMWDSKPVEVAKMNLPWLMKDWAGKISDNLIEVMNATFVSLFVPAKLVREKGLPISEFFIWSDDTEYTDRLTHDLPGYLVLSSVVTHAIQNNEKVNIVTEGSGRIERYYYSYRNRLYIAKQKGLTQVAREIIRTTYFGFKVIGGHDELGTKLKKIKVMVKGTFAGLSFKPKVKWVNGH